MLALGCFDGVLGHDTCICILDLVKAYKRIAAFPEEEGIDFDVACKRLQSMMAALCPVTKVAVPGEIANVVKGAVMKFVKDDKRAKEIVKSVSSTVKSPVEALKELLQKHLPVILS